MPPAHVDGSDKTGRGNEVGQQTKLWPACISLVATGRGETPSSSWRPCSSLLLDPSTSAARDLLAEDAARRTRTIYRDTWEPLEQPAILQVLPPPPPPRFIHFFIASGTRDNMVVVLTTRVRIGFRVRDAFTRNKAAQPMPCPAPIRSCRDLSCKCRAHSRCVNHDRSAWCVRQHVRRLVAISFAGESCIMPVMDVG